MSRERAQAAASRQLASVGSETTAETTSRRMRVYALRIARTFVVHFEWEVSLRFQGGKCLEGGSAFARKQGFGAYILHSGQLGHIGISEDRDLDSQHDQFSTLTRLGDGYEPCELSCS